MNTSRGRISMSLSLKRPLVSIDIESTGVDTENDRIVELALVVLTPGGLRDTKCRRLNPGMPIPPIASEVHGITDQDVAQEPTFERLAKSLHHLLSDCDITGYNVRSFDVPLLAAEFARCRIRWPSEDQIIVDAYEIFRRQEPHRLANALEYYTGVVDVDFHSADADAEAALDVLISQSIRYIDDERATLADLLPLAKDPDWIDEGGKTKWVGSVPVMNFGKWDGRALEQVDTTYFEWVIKQDFPDDFKQLCRAAIAGRFPRR